MEAIAAGVRGCDRLARRNCSTVHLVFITGISNSGALWEKAQCASSYGHLFLYRSRFKSRSEA